MKLNRAEKKTVLIDMVKRLKEEMEENGEMTIDYTIIGVLTRDGFAGGVKCSIIETEDGQRIIYSPAKKGLYYVGELAHDYGGNKTHFRIDSDISGVLSESLKSNLKAVYSQKKTKTWFFPERIDNPSIGL